MEIATGDFFFHSEYGVGQVLQYIGGTEPEIEIRFQGRQPEQMTVFLLSRNAVRISPDGFRSLSFREPETAAQLIKEKPVDVIILTLEDFRQNKAKTEELKDYLQPFIQNWESWWEDTQPLLKADPRIDSSNSKLREYGLAHEAWSQAEKFYHSFKRGQKFGADVLDLSKRARDALINNRKDQKLAPVQNEELLGFLHQIVSQNRYELKVRLGTLFRISEDKLFAPAEYHESLVKLLEEDFLLYEIEPYTARRVVEELVRGYPGSREIRVLSSGMAAEKDIRKYLVDFAVRKVNPEIVSSFLLAALTENLPPKLPQEKLADLRGRLEDCILLVRSIPGNYPGWPDVLKAFSVTCAALPPSSESKIKLKDIDYILPALVALAKEIFNRTCDQKPELMPDVPSILASPEFSTEYLIAILSFIDMDPKAKVLADKVKGNLLQTAQNRQDNFWIPFLTSKAEGYVQQAREIFAKIQEHRSPYLTERGGAIICDLARQASVVELVQMIPVLDGLYTLSSKFSWQESLEGLRYKAYQSLFSDPTLHKVHSDDAVIMAAMDASKLMSIPIQEEVTRHKTTITKAQEHITSLEALLKDKENVLRELRSNVGGDTEDARFDERSRILRDIVTSLAEFERFSAAQGRSSNDLEAVITRFNRILATYKVIESEQFGARVNFNPQKHRLVESGNIQPNQPVIVVERGFLIRDQKDRMRLLKPALVKVA